MNQRKKNTLKSNEQGIVAIVLTVFVITVLSLVVLAFAQQARREQRQSLDRQLSSQAFYAAESGINSTINGIRTGTITSAKDDDCSDQTGNSLDTADNFSYSCVLFSRELPEVEYSSVDTVSGEFVSLHAKNDNLSKLIFNWNNIEGSVDYSGCPSSTNVKDLPRDTDYGSACTAGVLRVSLMPVSSGAINREAIYNDMFTVYLRPSSDGAGRVSYQGRAGAPNSQGKIVAANCSAVPGRCSATIVGLPSGGAIFMQIRSLYHDNSTTIIGKTISDGAVIFDQAQIKVDSTGKAADVLKRLQVRVPLFQSNDTSSFPIDALGGICKRITTHPTIVSGDPFGAVTGEAGNGECDTMDGQSSTD